ncbi:hypothetical protein Terro_3641 [Terriglobus roseus DSM 18391]|uniref:Outer membrane protein beta-barrel domain-containing protein n=1 Tax=Terriglobus roseus (strain DSM 18391 / NRRL B-41598 / KBS 63) TaxID=926566 RepID=I3ZKT7_TERRK|nr:hypothetical protein [Terriglobus roseus]AFL89855.1 hypothetical protein Terro_3641 [Terriglobus roseus DSM 18391]
MLISRPRPRSAGSLQPVASGPQHPIQPATGTAFRTLVLTALCGLTSFAAAGVARAQDTFRPPPPVTYTEKYEVYGGINFMNGQAGQNLPKRYNMAGGEVMGTYWFTPKLGAAADIRWDGGTTPVLPGAQATSPKIQTRPFVSQFMYMGGVHYHLTGNQLVGMNLHALAGAASGNFDHSNPGLPTSTFVNASGLYSNRTSAVGVAGVSFDFNRSSRLAIRISPEIVFEHFGTELREFVYVSGGVLYRFGNR